jgi:hypothetical protein
VQKTSQVGYGWLDGNVEVAHRPAASLSWSKAYRVYPSICGVVISAAPRVGVVDYCPPGSSVRANQYHGIGLRIVIVSR